MAAREETTARHEPGPATVEATRKELAPPKAETALHEFPLMPKEEPEAPARRENESTGILHVVIRDGKQSTWASVRLDGELVGETFFLRRELPAGRHTLQAHREGYEPAERVVDVRSGEVHRLLLLLARKDPP